MFDEDDRAKLVDSTQSGALVDAMILVNLLAGCAPRNLQHVDGGTRAYVALASIAADSGCYRVAENCLRAGLEHLNSTCATAINRLEMRRKIAVVQLASGNVEGSRRELAYLATAAEIWPGPTTVQFGLVANSLGVALRQTGNFLDAREWLEKATTVFVTEVGELNDHYATVLLNLSELISASGRLMEGVSLAQRALEICFHMHGEPHRSVAFAYANLGRLLFRIGETAEAARCFARAGDILATELGHRHPEVNMQRYNQIVAQSAQ